jgi:hypothetical protein
LDPLERALTRWRRVERIFAQSRYNGNDTHAFLQKEGRTRSLFVAPHAVNHYSGMNDDDLKVADVGTGGLAIALANHLNAGFAVNSARIRSINPRFGYTAMDRAIVSQGTRSAETRCAIVFDLHGCKDTDDFDFAVGTCGPPTDSQAEALESVQSSGAREGVRVAVNPAGYSGLGDYTMVRRHKMTLGVGLIQIEICRRLRNPSSNFGLVALRCIASAARRLEKLS